MTNVSPKFFSIILPFLVFILASIIWFLILIQSVNFIFGFVILSLFSFVIFWQGLLISRKSGELFTLKNRRQIIIISLAVTLGFSELIWVISFLPFSFFVLAGLFSAIFATIFDVIKEYFKKHVGLFEETDRKKFNKILIRDILSAAIFIIIIISLSSWLPLKTS